MPKIIATFQGEFHCIEGDEAVFTLSAAGECYSAVCKVDELVSKGITEGRRFICNVVESDDGILSIEFVAIPLRELTDEEEREIADELDRLLPNDIRGAW